MMLFFFFFFFFCPPIWNLYRFDLKVEKRKRGIQKRTWGAGTERSGPNWPCDWRDPFREGVERADGRDACAGIGQSPQRWATQEQGNGKVNCFPFILLFLSIFSHLSFVLFSYRYVLDISILNKTKVKK